MYTDHLAVSLTLKCDSHSSRGNGLWKINNSILKDVEYVQIIERVIDNLIAENLNLNKRKFWDYCKVIIKHETINYCKMKSKLVPSEIQILERELEMEYADIDNREINISAKLDALEQRLNVLYDEKAKASQIRARINWVESGEKNTNFFLGLEKQRQKKVCIRELKKKNGEILSAPSNDVLHEVEECYSTLYKSNTANEWDVAYYLQTCELQRCISDEDTNRCEGLLTNKECTDAVSKMKLNKSPGSDGLSAEFYKMFEK